LHGAFQPGRRRLPLQIQRTFIAVGRHCLAERQRRCPSHPEMPPDTRALPVVKGKARKQLKGLEATRQRQKGYAKVSRFPIEIQESLEYEARAFSQLADELQRAIEAQPEDQQT
ncbi:hypothetical protein SB816_30355, partial [Achromobacter sp. SIMBA_011]|uniref:hypothetical protein n=1 Tax=Achromobacter sp. SIMBA_011 TaxID=3085759 RepID=UPI003977F89A